MGDDPKTSPEPSSTTKSIRKDDGGQFLRVVAIPLIPAMRDILPDPDERV